MPGIAHVDLSDEDAASCFSDFIAHSWISKDKMIDYSVQDFKRVGRWSEIHKYRALLGGLLKASNGRLLRQRVLCKQFRDFLVFSKVEFIEGFAAS